MHVAVIGLGLIGGSVAVDLKLQGFAKRITGVECNPLHSGVALRLGLVDEVLSLATAVGAADCIVVAVPVDAARKLLPEVLALIGRRQVVTDMCSTKQYLAEAVAGHPQRGRYVGSHPMAGTENSGPWAARAGLFTGKVAILCDTESCEADAVETVETLYRALDMRTVRMDAARHDLHVAYVSHISHVAAYALALAVLDKERDERRIFDLASGGFGSTARLAKSAPEMWTPIFLSNRDAVIEAIDAFRQRLDAFRDAVADGDGAALNDLIRDANRIRRVLPD